MQRNLFFLACFFIGVQVLAQQYPFIYYTPKDGLINSRVRSIKQDSKGRMYFITLGGLSVYDGARFINYSRQNGLANELVNDVIELTSDSLLIATNAPALNTLVNGKIDVFKTADNFCPVVNRFFKNKNGNWYAAADQGLFLFSHNRFIKIPLLNEKGTEIGNYIDRITEWKNFLLLTTWNAGLKEKLIVYDTLKRKVAAIETSRVVNSTLVNSVWQIWATTDEGVWEMDTTSLQNGRISFIAPAKNYLSISKLKHSFAFFDAGNNLWFYTKKSIYRITSQGTYQTISQKQGLNATNLTDLFIDREGITWLATDGNGVVKWTNSGIELLNSINEMPAVITSIFQQQDSTWLFNSSNNSIYRICNNSTSIFPLSVNSWNI